MHGKLFEITGKSICSLLLQLYELWCAVETKRKELLRSWALNWLDFTKQPIDDIYLYFGTKVTAVTSTSAVSKKKKRIHFLSSSIDCHFQIAVYFAFLGMYTRWMLFPAGLGLISQLIDFGWVLPAPSIEGSLLYYVQFRTDYFGFDFFVCFFRPFQLLVLPIFFVSITLWAVMFFQFWKRKNSALLTRYVGVD